MNNKLKTFPINKKVLKEDASNIASKNTHPEAELQIRWDFWREFGSKLFEFPEVIRRFDAWKAEYLKAKKAKNDYPHYFQ